MYAGGSGLNFIVHVKLIVEPLSKCKSGAPWIAAVGTDKNKFLLFICLSIFDDNFILKKFYIKYSTALCRYSSTDYRVLIATWQFAESQVVHIPWILKRK